MWLEIILFLLLLLVYAVLRDRRPPKCPPGPTEVPFFGNLPIFTEGPAEKLKEKYGDIVMHRTGNLRSIFIFDYQVAKEAMARLDFADRPALFTDFSIDDQKIGGVVSSNGPHWQHDRRFVLRNLRNLGMGRSYLEEAINIEAKALVEDLRKYNGEAINYPDSFRTAALNIIWQMVAISPSRPLVHSGSAHSSSGYFSDCSSVVIVLPGCRVLLHWGTLPFRVHIFLRKRRRGGELTVPCSSTR